MPCTHKNIFFFLYVISCHTADYSNEKRTRRLELSGVIAMINLALCFIGFCTGLWEKYGRVGICEAEKPGNVVSCARWATVGEVWKIRMPIEQGTKKAARICFREELCWRPVLQSGKGSYCISSLPWNVEWSWIFKCWMKLFGEGNFKAAKPIDCDRVTFHCP